MYRIILSAFAVLAMIAALIAFEAQPSFSSVPASSTSTVHIYGTGQLLVCQQSGNFWVTLSPGGHTVIQLQAGGYCFVSGGSKGLYIDGTSTYSLTIPFKTNECSCNE